MALFFFLANTLLILIVIYALRFPIILLVLVLWKLRYMLLGAAALLGLSIFMFYHNERLNWESYQASHPPVIYKDPVIAWNEAHPEVFHPASPTSPRTVDLDPSDWTKVIPPTPIAQP